MPVRISAFPKCYLDDIAGRRTMTVFDWIQMARSLDADGLEMYEGFFTSLDPVYLDTVGDAIRAAPLVSRSRSSRCREPATEESMSTIPQTYEASLKRVCRDTIRPNAATVDCDGLFPERSIDALKSAGFLGVMSSPEVGGLGLGIPGATAVVRRVAEECASTAMVLCTHYCGAAVLEAHDSSQPSRSGVEPRNRMASARAAAAVTLSPPLWPQHSPQCRHPPPELQSSGPCGSRYRT